MSPVFTSKASLGCTLFTVSVSPFSNLDNSSFEICGVLSASGAWPAIETINFLKAKSNTSSGSGSGVSVFIILSSKGTSSFSTITTGWSLVLGFATDQ